MGRDRSWARSSLRGSVRGSVGKVCGSRDPGTKETEKARPCLDAVAAAIAVAADEKDGLEKWAKE